MASSFTAATRDSLSNLAASLGSGKDKAAQDAFFVFDLDRSQVEAMYRGDWLARKVVDIVPYEVVAPGRGSLVLHPSRVVRFLGNAWPDPSLMPSCWSDSVLQVLYDAIHAVALTTAGATSLMHEAKVDVVTVPNLSEHLSSSDTTSQLSARFAYAAAMKSINNLLLLGDGETWNRQKIDFAGLPEMVRTFLQVAAEAADIPVTRLLGQSPSGLSATGDSDIRNDARHDRGAAGSGTHADASAWDPSSISGRNWNGSTV